MSLYITTLILSLLCLVQSTRLQEMEEELLPNPNNNHDIEKHLITKNRRSNFKLLPFDAQRYIVTWLPKQNSHSLMLTSRLLSNLTRKKHQHMHFTKSDILSAKFVHLINNTDFNVTIQRLMNIPCTDPLVFDSFSVIQYFLDWVNFLSKQHRTSNSPILISIDQRTRLPTISFWLTPLGYNDTIENGFFQSYTDPMFLMIRFNQTGIDTIYQTIDKGSQSYSNCNISDVWVYSGGIDEIDKIVSDLLNKGRCSIQSRKGGCVIWFLHNQQHISGRKIWWFCIGAFATILVLGLYLKLSANLE
eukprot:17755_1